MTPEEIYTVLIEHYGKPRWWSEDPYTVMFQSVLVQNTAWTNVEKTTGAIGSRLSPGYISELSDEELGEAIRSCGFFRAKAKTIRALTAWFGKYGFRTENAGNIPAPELRNELLSLKGIGEETADVILVYAFHKLIYELPGFFHGAFKLRLVFGILFLSDRKFPHHISKSKPQGSYKRADTASARYRGF